MVNVCVAELVTKVSSIYQPSHVYPALVVAEIVVCVPNDVAPSMPLTLPASAIFFSNVIGQTIHLAVSTVLDCGITNI